MTTKFRTIHSYSRRPANRRTTMQSGVIIRRNSGLLVPDAYAELAIKANPTAWGAAIVTEGELQLNKGEGLDLEMFKDTIQAFDKQDITFYLCSSPSAIDIGDVSPFTILTNDDKEQTPLLVAFIEGNFPQFEKTGSSHPAEFFVANEYLIPKLQELFELADGDIAKVMSTIQKPYFKREMMNVAVPRGAITLVSATGEALTFAQADDSAEYPWGWVSKNLGYAKAAPAEKAEEPKKKGMFSVKSTVREKAQTTPSSAVAAAVVPPKTTTAVAPQYKIMKWRPENNMSRSNKKEAYKQRIGYLPAKWADNVEIEVYVKADTNKLLTFSEVKKLGLAAVGLPALNNPPPQHNPPGQEGGKDVQPDHVVVPEKAPASKGVTTECLPLISPQTREHILKIMGDAKVQKLIADNADIISDPNKVKALEAKFVDFSAQLGMKKIDDFMSWSFEMMYDLAKAKPDGIAVMCWTFRNMLAGKMAKEAKAPEGVVQETAPTTAQKKSMFSKKAA